MEKISREGVFAYKSYKFPVALKVNNRISFGLVDAIDLIFRATD